MIQQQYSSSKRDHISHQQHSLNNNNAGAEVHSQHASRQKLPSGSSANDNSQKVLTQVSASGKQNKSYVVGPKNSMPPSAQNSLLNATLMAMINQKQGKSQTRPKSKSGTNAYQIGKKPVGRAKSACKGKAELFNSTAPIKFFSNLEETVREITTLNGANLKMSNGATAKIVNRPSSKNKHQAVKDHVYSG